MIFTDTLFFPFFVVVVVAANFALIRWQKTRMLFLTAASFYFYATWNWKLAGLIMISSLIDYFGGLLIHRSKSVKSARFFLALSLCGNLGILGFFKYFNFFADNVSWLFGNTFTHWNIILPVGISFYTFQTMSYSIDVYRKHIKPEKDFLRFIFFVSFFPQLVAGPIVRAAEFLPQTHKKIKVKKRDYLDGIQIFISGFVKKVLIANLVAVFADAVFASPASYNSLTTWLAVIAYALQIFCDFSGYSDMAIGTAKMLGYNLVTNFNLPYISLNITDFWRRWHMSLSRWIKDYIYISLGGNRKGKVRQYFNLIITMLLGGLWHGASWNFVVWGGMHGFALAFEKMTGLDKAPKSRIFKAIAWIITMVFVLCTWVVFRARTFGDTVLMWKKMFAFSGAGINWVFMPLIIIIPIVVFAHVFGVWLREKKHQEYLLLDLKKYYNVIILAVVIMLIFVLAPSNAVPFIYFQF